MFRREDLALVNGTAKFMQDINLENPAYMAICSSKVAHAHIKSIDISEALKLDGVLDVITGQDIKHLNPLPVLMNPAGKNGKFPPHPWGFPAGQTIIAIDKVRHIGETVAVVVAVSQEVAELAVDSIKIDYDILPHVLDARSALLPGAPIVHETIPDNLCQYVSWGDRDQAMRSIENADVVVKQTLPFQLVSANAVEPRATFAQYSATTEEYTLWTNTQIPHINRAILAGLVLNIPFNKLRVIVPEIGGSFGSKGYIYSDTALALFLAKRTGRPIKWVDNREGLYLRTTHARGSDIDGTLAGSKDGKISAIYCTNYATLGAYSTFNGPGTPAALAGMSITSAYKIDNPFYETKITYTHRQMLGPMRGAGRTDGTYVVERLIDLYAAQIGMDPAEVRRLNYVKKDNFPYKNKLGFTYDSGDYAGSLELAFKNANLGNIETLKAEALQRNKILGVGCSSYVAVTGVGPSPMMHNLIGLNGGTYGTAHIRVHQSGDVELHAGSQPHGQGHVTVFAQMISEELGVDANSVDVIHSDTKGNLPIGGSYGSRSYQIEGGAIYMACQKIITKATRMAAHMLGVDISSIARDGANYYLTSDKTKSLTLKEISNALYNAWDMPADLEPGLDVIAYWDPKDFAFPYGSHVAVVEIDKDTGSVDVVKYVAVDDFGNVRNPTIVDGLTHGNIYMGLSQVLSEELHYDSSGMVVEAIDLEYPSLPPSALPQFEIYRTVSPTEMSPHGGKGAGDVVITGVPATVVNAVCNALAISHIDMPLTPERVWSAMQRRDHH